MHAGPAPAPAPLEAQPKAEKPRKHKQPHAGLAPPGDDSRRPAPARAAAAARPAQPHSGKAAVTPQVPPHHSPSKQPAVDLITRRGGTPGSQAQADGLAPPIRPLRGSQPHSQASANHKAEPDPSSWSRVVQRPEGADDEGPPARHGRPVSAAAADVHSSKAHGPAPPSP